MARVAQRGLAAVLLRAVRRDLIRVLVGQLLASAGATATLWAGMGAQVDHWLVGAVAVCTFSGVTPVVALLAHHHLALRRLVS